MATLDAPSEIWVKTKKLKESGLEYKEGKYSAEEKQKLTAAIEAYKEEHNLTEDQLQVLIYKRRNSQISEDHKMFTSQHKDMWKDIARTLPDRSVESQYRCVQRMFDAQNKKGKWTADEDQMLQELAETTGRNWVHIGQTIGRTATGCLERFKVLERSQQEKLTGKWTQDEDERYQHAIELLAAEGRLPDVNDRNFWETIALHVESRTYLQCRQKYYRQSAALSTAADETADPLADKIGRWNFACDGVLVQKLRMLGVHDEADIEWKLLRDEELPWPQAKIHDAYKRLRKHVPMADEKSFEDIVQGMEEYVNERNEKRSKRNSTGVRKAKADALTMTPAAVGDDEDQGYYEDHHYAQEEQQYYDAEGAVEYELEAGIAYPPKHEEEDELQPSSEAEKPVQKKKKEKKRKADEDPELRALKKAQKKAKRDAKKAKKIAAAAGSDEEEESS